MVHVFEPRPFVFGHFLYIFFGSFLPGGEEVRRGRLVQRHPCRAGGPPMGGPRSSDWCPSEPLVWLGGFGTLLKSTTEKKWYPSSNRLAFF